MLKKLLLYLSVLMFPLILEGKNNFFSVSDGLSNESVKAVYQDETGYIWLGTKYGLNRFDGYEFRQFFVDMDGMSQKNDIVSLVPDGCGHLWVGTFDGVILFDLAENRYVKTDVFCSESAPKGVVVGINIISDNNVWVATKQGLFHYYDKIFTKSCLFQGNLIRAMGATDDGYMLLDIENEGIAVVDAATGVLIRMNPSFENMSITCIVSNDKYGTFLFSDTDGAVRYDKLTGHLEKVTMDSRKLQSERVFNQIHCAVACSDKEVLLGTDTGIARFNLASQSIEKVCLPFLDAHRIMSAYIDTNNNIWAGTFSAGVYLAPVSPQPFEVIYSSSFTGTGEGVINLLYSDGRVIEGRKNEIIIRDRAGKPLAAIPTNCFPGIVDKSAEIYHIDLLRSGKVFIYVLNQGSFVLDPATSVVRQMAVDISSSSQIKSVCEDACGNLWLAADDLYVMDKTTRKISDRLHTNDLGYTRYMLAQTLYQDNNGNMFVGTRTRGLWRYVYDCYDSNPYGKAERFGKGLPTDANVVKVLADRKGNVWVGTYNHGLYVFDNSGNLRCHFDKTDGLDDNTVCSLVEDERSGMWVSTLGCIAMVDADGANVVKYSSKNGYPLLKNSPSSMCIVAEEGDMYVGGDGMVRFAPSLLCHKPNRSMHVTVTGVNILGAPSVSVDVASGMQKMVLNHPYNSLEMRLSNLLYMYQSACQYAYKMSSDSDWKILPGNEIVVSHMKYGKHTFLLRCTDEYGVWSDDESVFEVEVKAPWWLTIYAKVTYVFLALVLASLLILMYLRGKKAEYKHMVDKAERDNLEKAYMERMNLFTQFSHELRTPLTLIKSPVEDMMTDDGFPEKYRFTINQIYRNANKMLMLVNQLLDFRRIEHESLKLHLSQVDSKSFLSDQLSNFKEIASKKNISLSLDCRYYPEDLWLDIDLFERVMVNLLSNAVKHTPVGGNIVVGTLPNEGKKSVTFYVKDNGSGISAANIERIFEPFYQVNKSGTDNFGSGIGLTLVRNVVSMHDGRVWVESREGEGSTFYVEVPLGTAVHEGNPLVQENEFQTGESVTIPAPAVGNPQSDGKPCVLVVEDDEEMREYIKSRLACRFKVITATDGDNAIGIANEILPDLIVSDVMMPNMDGITFCSSIKNSMVTAHIPVILLTAKDHLDSVEAGYNALADDYILKPFNSKILLAKCDSIIFNRQILRQRLQQNLAEASDDIQKNTGDIFIDRIIELVNDNLDSPELTVAFLYKNLNMSRAQFFKKVKAVSDMSPNKIIISVKMNIAAKMLRSNKMTVSEVAYSTGFADPSYFSRVFKSVYNVSPSDYKNNHE